MEERKTSLRLSGPLEIEKTLEFTSCIKNIELKDPILYPYYIRDEDRHYTFAFCSSSRQPSIIQDTFALKGEEGTHNSQSLRQLLQNTSTKFTLSCIERVVYNNLSDRL